MVWARGTQIHGYTIDSVLGEGGFGITYKALKRFGNSDQWVVLKTINDERRADPEYPKFVELFKKEVTVMAELMPLKHQHMASVYDYCDTDNLLYCVIQFIDGENLKKRVVRKGKLPELEALLYIEQIGNALDALHKHGKIHRDAHPQNIMISDGQALLIDFGLVCSIESTGSVFIGAGFPGYAPGEQFNNPYQAYNRQRTVDIYTLASSLYYALTAEDPDPNDNTPPQQVNPEISDRVNDAIVKARQRDPRKRPQSIPAWFRLLLDVRTPQAPHTPQNPSRSRSLYRPERTSDLSGGRRSFLQWFGGFMVTGVAGALALDYFGGREEPIPENPTPETSTPVPSTPEPPTPTSEPPSEIINYDLPNNGGTLELIRIPAGTLVMEDGGHRVTLQEFYMGKYAVTQRQYEAVMNNNPARFTGDLDRPVEQVNWNDAVSFCDRLGEIDGKKVQLPSETQWEWAARGATESKGYTYAGSNDLDEVGWYTENSNNTTHPVGQKAPNELGLYDMSGNVWEWCQDNWTSNANVLPQDGTPLTNGGDNDYRAVRGGSWYDGSDNCRSGYRYSDNPDGSINHRGFRVVLLLS